MHSYPSRNLDRNGRIGRLLIPLLLHDAGILQQPLLYLSLYSKQYREEYYRCWIAFSRGRLGGVADFFLEGVVALFKEDAARVPAEGRGAATSGRHCDRQQVTVPSTAS